MKAGFDGVKLKGKSDGTGRFKPNETWYVVYDASKLNGRWTEDKKIKK